jgi:hypothetical protein
MMYLSPYQKVGKDRYRFARWALGEYWGYEVYIPSRLVGFPYERWKLPMGFGRNHEMFPSKETAMAALDDELVRNGWSFLTQEQWDRWSLLV